MNNDTNNGMKNATTGINLSFSFLPAKPAAIETMGTRTQNNEHIAKEPNSLVSSISPLQPDFMLGSIVTVVGVGGLGTIHWPFVSQ